MPNQPISQYRITLPELPTRFDIAEEKTLMNLTAFLYFIAEARGGSVSTKVLLNEAQRFSTTRETDCFGLAFSLPGKDAGRDWKRIHLLYPCYCAVLLRWVDKWEPARGMWQRRFSVTPAGKEVVKAYVRHLWKHGRSRLAAVSKRQMQFKALLRNMLKARKYRKIYLSLRAED